MAMLRLQFGGCVAAVSLTLLSSCSSQLSLNAVRKGSSLESAIREGLDSAL